MPKFAANLTMLFTEYPFLERFEVAHKVGFKAVEFLFPYALKPEEIGRELEKYGLEVVLFNLPPGDWDAGERGLAAIPGREEEFRASVATTLTYAKALNCKRVHAMSGNVAPDGDRSRYLKTWLNNFHYAAEVFAKEGIVLLTEPLNPRNMPGYFVSSQYEAVQLIKQVKHSNIKLQFDIYHAQIVDGDLTTMIRELKEEIGHIQIASVPERNEPVDGEVNYPYLFKVLDDIGYQGWIGCEYNPARTTIEGVGWVQPYL